MDLSTPILARAEKWRFELRPQTTIYKTSPFNPTARSSDVSIFRPGAAAEWWISKSSDGSVLAAQFGAAGDLPAAADYTGDGKTDMAFFRPSTGTWFILRSEDLSFYGFPFGSSADVPAPADYDGDGKTDAAVFRQSGAQWFVSRSSGGVTSLSFGAACDQAVPGIFVR